MRGPLLVFLTVVLVPAMAVSQYSTSDPTGVLPGSAGSKDGGVVQHGAQPNPQEVRPGNRDGNSPSATAGSLVTDPVERRILGLPVVAALVIAAVILALFAVAGVLIPNARRRSQARGNGTGGGP